jgi:rhodanese-related sulfurtransferase
MNNINVETLKKWMEEDSVTLVDVRRRDEYDREHIKGAVNIPLDTISDETFSQIRTKNIVFQCNTGGRSSRTCSAVEKIDTEHDIHSLEGGIESWKTIGNETVKTKRIIALPLHRQVQIGAGSLIVLGVAMGYLVNPVVYIMSLFVGIGLLGAGITGWCGMGEMLGRAPWNRINE